MFEQVKQEIDDKIKTNGNNEITANRLNGILQDMMDASAEVIEEVQQSIGDQVEANPTEEPTDTLEKIKIGEGVFEIPQTDTSELVTEQELQKTLNNYVKKTDPHSPASGNLVAFDKVGGLGNSGKKVTDFATAAQGTKADTAIQPSATTGLLKNDGTVDTQTAGKAASALQPIQNATPNNFASFDSNGGIQDSGCNEGTFIKGVKKGTETLTPVDGVVTIPSDIESAQATSVPSSQSATATIDNNHVLQLGIPRGADAVNPFKGWFDAVVTGEAGSRVITSETQNLPANPVIGDYAYVKTWEISGTAPTQTETPITRIYECTTAGSWSDSGRTADTSNVQTFMTGQPLNEVGIDAVPTSGSDNLVKGDSILELLKDPTSGFNIQTAYIKKNVSAYSYVNSQTKDDYPIKTGTIVYNAGIGNINLYSERGNDSAPKQTVYPGRVCVTTINYASIRNGNKTQDVEVYLFAGSFQKESIIDTISLANPIQTFENVTAGRKALKHTIKAGTKFNIRFDKFPADKTSLYISLGYNFDNNSFDYPLLTIIPGDNYFILPTDVSDFQFSVAPWDAVEFITCLDYLNKEIGVDSIQGTHSKSPNLFDKDSLLNKYYIVYSSGVIATANTLSLSNRIQVEPETTYYVSGTSIQQYCFFDEQGIYLSGGQSISIGTITTPQNAKYLIFSVTTANANLLSITKGSTAPEAYQPYWNKVTNKDILAGVDPEDLKAQPFAKIAQSRYSTPCVSISSNTFTNGDKVVLGTWPHSIRKNRLSFYAKVTDFTGGIRIGCGSANAEGSSYIYDGGWLEIDETNITGKYYNTETHALTPQAHGLTISSFIKIILSVEYDSWKVSIQTLNGQYDGTCNMTQQNGFPLVESLGASLENVSFSVANPTLQCPIWMFGDSYYGINNQSRVLYWIKEWGYLNCLVQSYAGQGASSAIEDLNKMLELGAYPKYIVWSLGMNNQNYDAWLSYSQQLKEICAEKDIELVFQTIPQPKDTTSYLYKDEMSDWIRDESDCRYIDAASAVGSNEDGEWYGDGESYDYQSSDNVHPTQYGAKAIASQYLVDFPELMQY